MSACADFQDLCDFMPGGVLGGSRSFFLRDGIYLSFKWLTSVPLEVVVWAQVKGMSNYEDCLMVYKC